MSNERFGSVTSSLKKTMSSPTRLWTSALRHQTDDVLRACPARLDLDELVALFRERRPNHHYGDPGANFKGC